MHADALTFELWIEGDRTVVDYGVSSYVDDEERQQTRATRSHNTVELDGRDSSEVWGALRVARRARGKLEEVRIVDGEVTVHAEHDGYRWLPGQPVHRRSVRVDVTGGLPAVSSLRCDLGAIARRPLVVQGIGGGLQEEDGVWYPPMAMATSDARVYRQHRTGAMLRWALSW